MLDKFYSRSSTRDRILNGPLGSLLPILVATFEERGYSTCTVSRMILNTHRLAVWLKEQDISVQEAGQADLGRYISSLGRRQNSRGSLLPKPGHHLRAIARVLREQGALCGAAGMTDVDLWAHRFSKYLVDVRGISERSTANYVRYARRLMDVIRADGALDWAGLGVEQVGRLIQGEAQRSRVGTCVCAVSGLRCFLRFLELEGAVQPNLARAIPPLRCWKDQGLPRGLASAQIASVIEVCNSHTEESLRNRAMILMMARLGVRAGEVRQLHLDDIDWREGVIHIRRGKSRAERILPLPEDVGQAMVAYIQQERPKSSCRDLFLRTIAPYRGLMWSSEVSKTAKRFLSHAGIKGERITGHCLRHTVASQLVCSGGSFQEAADMLGHKSLQSTRVCAKLDEATLQQVALPWPGGER